MKYPDESNLRFPRDHESSPRLYYSKLLGPFYRRKLEMLCDCLPRERVPHILEIGFGSGIALKELAGRSEKVTAIDVHPHQAAVEEMLRREAVANVRLRTHDIFERPFENGALFDCALSSSVFEHIPPAKLETGVGNISRSLKEGGSLLVGFPLKNGLMNAVFGMYERFYKPFRRDIYDFSGERDHPSGQGEIIPALAQHFEILEKKYFIHDWLPLYLVLKCRKR